MRDAQPPSRGLAVLADGLQAAFTVGAVAALWRAGSRWRVGCGAGLGAQVAALGLLGEAQEGERRWRRQGELGCPLLAPGIEAARRRLGAGGGVLLVPDALDLDGWLDPAALTEHLAPEAADLPGRLRRNGVSLAVAVEDLGGGACRWVDLEGCDAAGAATALEAAARFPGGWGALVDGCRTLWGGVGAAPADLPAAGSGSVTWDVVCGFPVPAVLRPGLGHALLELVQRRAEVKAAERVQAWQARADTVARVMAPHGTAWRDVCGHAAAELGVEYPLPWERNGALVPLLLGLGEAVATRAVAGDRR